MYKKSQSLCTYFKREKEVFILLRTSRKAYPKDTITVKNIHLVTPVYRAAAVLLYSHLEGYIEDVVEETLKYLNNSGICSNNLPTRLKIANCIREVDEIAATTSIDRKEAYLNAFIIENYPLWSGEYLPPAKLNTDCLTSDFANPSAAHIEKLFKKLGIERVFNDLFHLEFNRRTVGSFRSTIDALAELRHDIAHGNFTTTCTDKDLVGYLKIINLFCRCLDKRIGMHIQSLTGNFPWH